MEIVAGMDFVDTAVMALLYDAADADVGVLNPDGSWRPSAQVLFDHITQTSDSDVSVTDTENEPISSIGDDDLAEAIADAQPVETITDTEPVEATADADVVEPKEQTLNKIYGTTSDDVQGRFWNR